LNTLIKIPVCNIVACEDVLIKDSDKIYIYNPFTAVSGRNVKKFFTYSIIQEIPNGHITFKIQILSPRGIVLKETGENTAMVDDNIIRVKTQWINTAFHEKGQHAVEVLIKCNNDFDMVGCSYIQVF
jgi:hypothetical protein